MIFSLMLFHERAAVRAVPTFNRTMGEVTVGTCAGLKKNVEMGLDVTILVNADLVCTETITLSAGQDVSIASIFPKKHLVLIAEDFEVPDPSSATLIVNPRGASLALEQLEFANEAGTVGSPGAARAVWNTGSLDVNGCSFVSLNYASAQDGGAVSEMVTIVCAKSMFRVKLVMQV